MCVSSQIRKGQETLSCLQRILVKGDLYLPNEKKLARLSTLSAPIQYSTKILARAMGQLKEIRSTNWKGGSQHVLFADDITVT